MAELTDRELLADFARTGAEHAFAALVRRHINLVYSTARRFTGDDTLAADITQAVFILLARKAGGISSRVVLTGWLYQAARLMAANALKQKIRRENREQEAFMQSTLNQNGTDAAWKQIAPILDDAMGALRETDRNAVLLRYFQDKPLAEVGAALGVSEDAARVRVNRALDKLRGLLTKKGVTLGAMAIAGAVTANSVAAAPAVLATTVTTAALTGTATGTVAFLTTTKIITMTTIQKIAVTAALTMTVCAGIYEARQAHDARGELTSVQAQQAPMQEQIRQLKRDLSKASTTIAGLNDDLNVSQKNNAELLKLRGEVGVLRAQLADVKSDAAKTAMTAPASTMPGNSNTDGPNKAMLDYLGNPVPPPPNLDAAYTKEGLINAIQMAAQGANIPLKSVQVDDAEFPYVVGVVTDTEADMKALINLLKSMDHYQYSGGVGGGTDMSMNITPRSAYPRDNGTNIDNRLMLRQSMFYHQIHNLPPNP
jgi:RNA polymerase sigma factor (sigma-70 family)